MLKLAGRALALIAVLAFIVGAQCASSCPLFADKHACCGRRHQRGCPDQATKAAPVLLRYQRLQLAPARYPALTRHRQHL